MKTKNGLAAALIASTGLVAPALCMAVAAAPSAASAQQAQAGNAAPAGTPQTTNEVVVTGTLFRRTNIETPSPVTVLSAPQIANAGITTVSDAIRTVSADNSGSIPTSFGVGFAAGSSGVALRGLTVNSTVVVIDGLRTAAYPLADDGQRSFVDLNTIPLITVDHVDVLKDSASSTYGADAIGGVVNIVMKNHFVGEQIEAEGGTSQHGGGNMGRISALVGYGDLAQDKYNAYIAFEFEQNDAIRVDQRGFPYNTSNLTSIGGVDGRIGQPGNFSGSIYGSVTPADAAGNPLGPTQILRPSGCGPLGQATSTPNATFGGNDTYCLQNQSLYYDQQPEQTKYDVYARFTAQINPDTQAYLAASYNYNRVIVNQQPSQIQVTTPTNTNNIMLPPTLLNGSLNPNDPFAAAGQYALINYAFGDIPVQGLYYDHVIRAEAGLKGTAFGWDYDLGMVAAHNWLNSTLTGFINYDQLLQDIATGAYSFIDPASNSAAVRSALSPDLSKVSTTDLDTVQLTISRGVYDLPGGPLNVAIGGAFRYEAAHDPDLNPDLAAQGLGVAHTIGSRTVGSIYFEADAPVIKPLDIDISGRYDHYSDVGDNFSPKAGIKFTPTRWLALRGTYSLGFRAPSFSENGSSASEGFTTQPVSALAPASYVAAHGGDAYVTQPYSIALLQSANPNIKPEKSRSWTVGAVLEPTRWFNLSVDYYHITKTDAIVAASAGPALAAYFAGQPLPQGYTITADLPDPNNPSALPRPAVVSSPYINANRIETDGIDIDARFKWTFPGDYTVTSDVSATDILHWDLTEPGEAAVDYVGTQSPYALSSGAGTPRWRGSWQTTLAHGPWSITATAYYTSGYKQIGLDFGDSCLYTGPDGVTPIPAGCSIHHFIDVDTHLTYMLNHHIQLFGDVMNLFDTNPPFNPANYAAINYNPTYAQAGIVGRFFKIGLKASF